MLCLPVPTLIYLWEIYIFPGWVYSAAGKYVDRSCEYINSSHTHESGNWYWVEKEYINGIFLAVLISCEVSLYLTIRGIILVYKNRMPSHIWRDISQAVLKCANAQLYMMDSFLFAIDPWKIVVFPPQYFPLLRYGGDYHTACQFCGVGSLCPAGGISGRGITDQFR